jgi:hypothetical protein
MVLNHINCLTLNQVIGLSCHRMSDLFRKLYLISSRVRYLNCSNKIIMIILFGVNILLLLPLLTVNKNHFNSSVIYLSYSAYPRQICCF